MSEILLTGGNGFVGRHLIEALQERGDGVRVLALPTEDTRWLEQRGIAVYRGDVRRRDTLVEPTRGADAVLHLAAMMDVWRPMRDYHAVNVIGTENVCQAALAAGVRRLVHMSSSSVYGVARGASVDEGFPLAPFRDPYPITKAGGDIAVQRMIAEDHLPAVIIRPDQIFGPGDHLHFGAMADRLGAGRAIIVGSGANRLPLVYVTDVVQGLLLALDHENAVGEAYNLTTDRPLTQEQLFRAIARAIDADPPRIHVPYRALHAAGCLAEAVARLSPSSRRPPITRLGAAFFGTDNHYAVHKMRTQLGYNPQVGLDEGVRVTAEWYRHAARRSPPQAVVAGPAVEEVTT